MKKFLALLIVCAMAIALVAACAEDTQDAQGADEPTPAATPAPDPDPVDPENETDTETPVPQDPGDENVADFSDLRVALVAHGPESIQFDGSFNEGSWNGILNFLNTHGLDPATHANFFQAHAPEDEARVDIMSDAIEWGADVLVLPGFHFAASVYTAANLFPDTLFVVLDTTTSPGPTPSNVVTILYAEEQSGFLAGYGVVMDGFRDLGFMGGVAVPAVVRFGHGFVQGAEHAARELGLEAGEVTISYNYIGAFAPSPEVQTMANAWYASGTELIFVAAGRAWDSVLTAADAGDGRWLVGVDVDQSGDSPLFLTSAMKALGVSVYDMLNDYVNGAFRGGSDLLFDASVNGIGLPMANSHFTSFTQAQYDAVYAQLVDGTVVVSTVLPPEGATPDPNDFLDFELVTVNFIN